MESVTARLDHLERRVEALHERLNDILEALAAQWQTLTDAAKATTVSIARTAPPPEALEPKRQEGPNAA